MQCLALVGMPGAGKSSVGRQIARRLGVPFTDSDVLIELRLGESIRSFFAREGESRFRDVEEEVLQAFFASRAEGVLATGGGAVLREANRHALRDAATVIYLHGSPGDLHRRLRRDTQRPLLQVADPRAALSKLYLERDPLYRDVARFVVETGAPSVKALAGKVVEQLEQAGCIDAGPSPQRRGDVAT